VVPLAEFPYSKLNSIIEKNIEKYNELINKLKSVSLEKIGLERYLLFGNNKYAKFCAIDGSKNVENLGDAYLIVAKAVKVIGEVRGDRVVVPREPIIDVAIEDDYNGEDTVRHDSIKLMLKLESELIDDECEVLFLDGPIIDPPIIANDVGKQNIPSLTELAEMRARKIYDILKKGRVVIGIAKRFSERFLVSRLVEKGILDSLDYREGMVVNLLLEHGAIGWMDWEEMGKISLPEVRGLYSAYGLYKSVADLKISSLYVRASSISPPVRVDVAYVNERPKVDEVLGVISPWVVEGKAELTLLTLLADTFSSVSADEVSKYKRFYESELFSKLSKDIRDKMLISNLILSKRV